MNQHYLAAWKRISIKIQSILKASEVLFNSLNSHSADGGAIKILYEDTGRCFEEIQRFKNDFEKVLPEQLVEFLKNFSGSAHFPASAKHAHSIESIHLSTLNPRLIAIATLESQISYLLNDTQTNIKKSVVVALAHLQRRLIVEEQYRALWIGKNERSFEKLGGVHLLLHKIWAFKSDTPEEKTDLVLSELINTEDPLYSSTEGLVLTEWKVAKNHKEFQEKIAEAKKQANRYRFNSLYPLELSNHCFLIIVSEKKLQNPHESNTFTENGITYAVINIAYDPDKPSNEARKVQSI